MRCGESVYAVNPKAVRFCLIGAVHRVAEPDERHVPLVWALKSIAKVYGFNGCLEADNDEPTRDIDPVVETLTFSGPDVC